MYKLDLYTGVHGPMGDVKFTGFVTAMAYTKDRKHVYYINYNGTFYHFDVAGERLETLGLCLTKKEIAAGMDVVGSFAIAVTPDDKRVIVFHSDADGGRKLLYEYDRGTGEAARLGDFTARLGKGRYGPFINGGGLFDTQGRLYFTYYQDPWIGAGLIRIDLNRID